MSSQPPVEALAWRHDGHRLEVELRQAPLNEIGTVLLAGLERLAAYLYAGASGARVVVIHSGQPGFCAGADLRELHAGLSTRHAWMPQRARNVLLRRAAGQFIDRVHAVFHALDQSPIPIVAAVHGVCFGGGFELALVCDRIVADKTARFCFPELRLGILPCFGGVPRLEREVGNAVVRDLLLTGRSLRATRAHALGVVAEVVPPGKALDAARSAADQIARFRPGTVAAAKRFIKPHPAARLARERALFLDLVLRPEVLAALDRFVADTSVRPYLPTSEAPGG